VLSSLFAGVYTFGSGPYCRINCLNTCASKAKDDSNIRSGLFSVIGS
jgi:hypothetical protein